MGKAEVIDDEAARHFRIDGQETIYFLEANPNPEIARYEEVAIAGEIDGISYEELIQKILNLGLRG